jgi:uncharacterized protein (TIGR02246 family)
MKRTTTLSLIGLLSLCAAVIAQAAAPAGDTEKAVEGLEQQWTQAQNANDSAREATYIADNAIFVNLEGKVIGKEKFIAEEKATKYTHVALDNVVVHVHGATAVATYTMTIKGTGADGKPMDEHLRATDTWAKMPDGKWQCVASVDSPLKS